jgi:anti-anti-sigma factor
MFRIECFSPDELSLTGDLDLSTYERLQVALGAFTGPIRLDLSDLRFMDSTGLHVLAERINSGPVTLVNPHRNVLRLLDLCGLRSVPGMTIESVAGMPRTSSAA